MIIPTLRVETPFLDAVSPATLADAMENECKLLAELAGVLRRQREGVARDDAAGVDDSVVAAHRVMHTLSEARARRRALLGVLVAAEDVPLDELDVALGARMTIQLTTARKRLQDEARVVAREIEINRRVLSGALEQGDRFLQALCGAATAPSYDQAATAANGGVLINQQV